MAQDAVPFFPDERTRQRWRAMGLATLRGRMQGYFIPARHASADRDEGYPALSSQFLAAEPSAEAILAAADDLAPDLRPLIDGTGPTARFRQDWFPRLDAVAAYTLVRTRRPGAILEIGSGHSTRFMARAIADGGLATTLTCIDPSPRADIARLPLLHIPAPFGKVDTRELPDLQAGDILFIDSSHVSMPGSDVDRLLLDLVPRLPAGVLIHIHDILLPDPYPAEWRWRGYGEQMLVAAMLIGEGFDILFASHWIASRRPDLIARGFVAEVPLLPGAREASLWLVKRTAASSPSV